MLVREMGEIWGVWEWGEAHPAQGTGIPLYPHLPASWEQHRLTDSLQLIPPSGSAVGFFVLLVFFGFCFWRGVWRGSALPREVPSNAWGKPCTRARSFRQIKGSLPCKLCFEHLWFWQSLCQVGLGWRAPPAQAGLPPLCLHLLLLQKPFPPLPHLSTCSLESPLGTAKDPHLQL